MAESNVYAEISALLDREEATIDSTVAGYDERLEEAISAARADRDDAVEPLTLRRAQLEVVRQTVKGLVEQAEEALPLVDPTQPSGPALSASSDDSARATTTSSTSEPSATDAALASVTDQTAGPGTSTPEEPESGSAPSSEESTPEEEPSTPPAEPSTPTGDDSQQLEPTPSDAPITVTPAGAATAVTASLAPFVEPETPVVMTKPSTGETLQVTAGDVIAAQDTSIADSDLPEGAKTVRSNSDFL